MRLQVLMTKKCLEKALIIFFLVVTLINLILWKLKSYYPKVALKECKSIGKGKKVIRYIENDLEIFSDDLDQED